MISITISAFHDVHVCMDTFPLEPGKIMNPNLKIVLQNNNSDLVKTISNT